MLDGLQQRLGYRFRTESLLVQALTHRSHGKSHNERLEFLGDSVLNCAVAAMLYARFSRFDEGDLSRLRSNLVKQQTLYEIGQSLALGESLVLGEGERRSGGLRRPSILADTVEAIVGAVFLDSDFGQAAAVIERLYDPVLKSVDPKTLGKDAKTLLQEYLQGRRIPLPVYDVVATHGAAHSQVFEVECTIPKLSVRVSGSGGSRRAAEQAAAKLALEAAMKLQAAAPKRAKVTTSVVRQPKAATPAGASAVPGAPAGSASSAASPGSAAATSSAAVATPTATAIPAAASPATAATAAATLIAAEAGAHENEVVELGADAESGSGSAGLAAAL